MQRKKIFDTVRNILGRGFRQSEVVTLDQTLDQALNRPFDRTLDEGTGRGVEGGRETKTEGHSGGTAKSSQNTVPSVSNKASSSLKTSPMAISADGIALIKKFEGCARLRTDGRVEAYPDPGTGGDPWTIGWGATGRGIGPGTIWSKAECDARLERDLIRYAADVERALGGAATSQSQFDALVSFHYNTGAIKRATLTRCHRKGDFKAALVQFARWNKAGGRVMKGLARRRRAEAALYASA